MAPKMLCYYDPARGVPYLIEGVDGRVGEGVVGDNPLVGDQVVLICCYTAFYFLKNML